MPATSEIFDALVVILIPGFFLIVITWLVERKMDAPVDKTSRFGQQLPAIERELLGDDWRDPVQSYFRHRWESHLRTRLAIAVTCGADPDLPSSENEERASATADPQDKGAHSIAAH